MDISRRKAQAVIDTVFGEDFFARRSTKTQPGARYEVARWTSTGKLKKIAAGKTWYEAVLETAKVLGRKDVLASAAEVYKLVTGNASTL